MFVKTCNTVFTNSILLALQHITPADFHSVSSRIISDTFIADDRKMIFTDI